MWLLNFAKKRCDDKTIQQTIPDINANDELIDKSPLIEDEVNRVNKFEELKKRLEHVKMVHAKLEVLKEERNINQQYSTAVHEHKNNEEYVSSNNNEKNDQINDSKIETILKVVLNLENNLQTLCEKVSHLIDMLDDIQKDRKEERQKEQETVCECNIKNNFNVHSTVNSINTSNMSSPTMITSHKSKRIKNTKSTMTTDKSKGKHILTKKNKKVTMKNVQTTLKANSTKSNIRGSPTNEIREENFQPNPERITSIGPDEKIDIIPEQCQVTTKSQVKFSNANCTSSTVRHGNNIDTVQSRQQKCIKPKSEFLNSDCKKRKIYSINRVAKDNNNYQNEIVYQITLEESET